MSGNKYKEVFNKVPVDENLKAKTKDLVNKSRRKNNTKKYLSVAALVFICISVTIGYKYIAKPLLNSDKGDKYSDNNEDVNEKACMIAMFVYNNSYYHLEYDTIHSLSDINLEEKKGKYLGELTKELGIDSTIEDYSDFSATYGVGGKIYEYKGYDSMYKIILEYNGELEVAKFNSYIDKSKSSEGLEIINIFNNVGGIKEIIFYTIEDGENGSFVPTIHKTIDDSNFIKKLSNEISKADIINTKLLKDKDRDEFYEKTISNGSINIAFKLGDNSYIPFNIGNNEYISFNWIYFYKLSPEVMKELEI